MRSHDTTDIRTLIKRARAADNAAAGALSFWAHRSAAPRGGWTGPVCPACGGQLLRGLSGRTGLSCLQCGRSPR